MSFPESNIESSRYRNSNSKANTRPVGRCVRNQNAEGGYRVLSSGVRQHAKVHTSCALDPESLSVESSKENATRSPTDFLSLS